MGTGMLRRRTCTRCHGAREPARPAHEANGRLTARALENRHADGTSSNEGVRPSRARGRWERFFYATSEDVTRLRGVLREQGQLANVGVHLRSTDGEAGC